MARQKKPEEAKSFPLWQSTFSDLMNLLLCFFVLLFSMSTVDAQKYEMVVQSLSKSFSVLPAGGTSVSSEGDLISSGVSALQQFDAFMNASTGRKGEENNKGNDGESEKKNVGDTGLSQGISDGAKGSQSTAGQETGGKTAEQNENEISVDDAAKKYDQEKLAESEKMYEAIMEAARERGIQDLLEVDFNGEYVIITMNGSVLFDSGKADVREDAKPLLDKLSSIIGAYTQSLIEVEGHTDTVPMHSAKFENNTVLSMYRAMYVADYMKERTALSPENVVSTGRGEYVPIADNSTAEGRALNRRVAIKIFNSYASKEAAGEPAQ